MTAFLLPSSAQDPKIISDSYQEEFQYASQIGKVYLLDFVPLLSKNYFSLQAALENVPQGKNDDLIYHGWMIQPEIYSQVYAYLKNVKCWNLINTPEQYLNCHYFPNWYSKIINYTFESLIIKNEQEIDGNFDNLISLGKSLIIKDYVSSQKRNWLEACFIPDSKDFKHLKQVVHSFVELQIKYRNGLEGGLVFRRYYPSLTNEYRFLIYHQKIITYGPHIDSENNSKHTFLSMIPKIINDIIACRIDSNFYTIDIAQQENGQWVCVEVGDGQVSSFPLVIDQKIKRIFEKLIV